MTTTKGIFGQKAGAQISPEGRAAYAQLETIFADYTHQYREKNRIRSLVWKDDTLSDHDPSYTRFYFEKDVLAAQHAMWGSLFKLDEDDREVVPALLEMAGRDHSAWSDDQKDNLRIMQKIYKSEKMSPENNPAFLHLLESIKAVPAEDKDFDQKADDIDAIFRTARELVEPFAKEEGVEPAQILLERFNKNAVVVDVENDLDALTVGLPKIIAQGEKTSRSNTPLPLPAIAENIQRDIVQKILERVTASSGIPDYNAGKKDNVGFELLPVASLGFCMGDDKTQITAIEVVEETPLTAIRNAIHEARHGLKDLSVNLLPPNKRDQSAWQQTDYGLHETETLFTEQLIRKPEFWNEVLPQIKESLGNDFDPDIFNAENLCAVVSRSNLRNENWSNVQFLGFASWMTKAELALLRGEIAARDLPDFWADREEELTGTRPDPDEFKGEHVDTFMAYARDGFFLYNSTYITGMKNGVLLYQHYEQQAKPDKNRDVFQRADDYLMQHVTQKGVTQSAEDIVTDVTGQVPTIERMLAAMAPQTHKAPAPSVRSNDLV